MTVRFRPPPLARFYEGDSEGADHAEALAQAREEGFAEGRAVGVREGHAAGISEGAARTRDAMTPELHALYESSAKRERYDTVADAVSQLLAQRESDLAALEATVRDVATAALRTLFPALLSHETSAGIAALLATAITERGQETLTLRAHPDTLAAVEAETAAAVAQGRLVLIPDEQPGFGAVEIAWSGGGLTFDPNVLLARVTEALANPRPASQSSRPPIPRDLVPPPPPPAAPFHVPVPPPPEALRPVPPSLVQLHVAGAPAPLPVPSEPPLADPTLPPLQSAPTIRIPDAAEPAIPHPEPHLPDPKRPEPSEALS